VTFLEAVSKILFSYLYHHYFAVSGKGYHEKER